MTTQKKKKGKRGSIFLHPFLYLNLQKNLLSKLFQIVFVVLKWAEHGFGDVGIELTVGSFMGCFTLVLVFWGFL